VQFERDACNQEQGMNLSTLAHNACNLMAHGVVKERKLTDWRADVGGDAESSGLWAGLVSEPKQDENRREKVVSSSPGREEKRKQRKKNLFLSSWSMAGDSAAKEVHLS
jgi:hypothetical protein